MEDRTPNPVIANQIRNMLSKSMTNLNDRQPDYRNSSLANEPYESSRTSSHHGPEQYNNDVPITPQEPKNETPESTQPKSILKKTSEAPVENGFRLLLLNDEELNMEDAEVTGEREDLNGRNSDTDIPFIDESLPKSSFKPATNYIYDLNQKYENEPQVDDMEDIILTPSTSDFKQKTLTEEMYNDDFAPYVIEINEGDAPEYAAVKKPEKNVHFTEKTKPVYDNVNENEKEMFESIMETMQRRKQFIESSDDDSDENEKPTVNDYTKRTSYVQSGDSKYSSQAANIFFAGNTPDPPPRRQTGRFDMYRDSFESEIKI